ncbi:MAG: hypothetical protein U1F25_00785 [Rubrivivax sp.]
MGKSRPRSSKRQGSDLPNACAPPARAAVSLEVPARNHFDVILDLADAAKPLGQRMLALLHSP